MEFTDLAPLIELLEDNIDDLEEALEPVLKSALSDTARKLPLLDRAHLYVLVTYAIESILFSYLRLNGVNAKEHPVFRELTRVKQYFEKINAAESAGNKQNVTLDKAAAGRFIKHALAGNKKLSLDLGKHSGQESAAIRTTSEGYATNQISNDPRKWKGAVFSNDDPDSDPEHIKSSDEPRSERIKRQVSSGGRERDGGTRAK